MPLPNVVTLRLLLIYNSAPLQVETQFLIMFCRIQISLILHLIFLHQGAKCLLSSIPNTTSAHFLHRTSYNSPLWVILFFCFINGAVILKKVLAYIALRAKLKCVVEELLISIPQGAKYLTFCVGPCAGAGSSDCYNQLWDPTSQDHRFSGPSDWSKLPCHHHFLTEVPIFPCPLQLNAIPRQSLSTESSRSISPPILEALFLLIRSKNTFALWETILYSSDNPVEMEEVLPRVWDQRHSLNQSPGRRSSLLVRYLNKLFTFLGL